MFITLKLLNKILHKLVKNKMSTWPTQSPAWTQKHVNVLLTEVSESTPTNLKEIIEKSKEFPIKFPTLNVTSENLTKTVAADILEKHIQTVYPIIHEYGLFLCANFLLFKREHGTQIEKNLYKDMSVLQLIDRLLKKRAVSFMFPCDTYLLLDGSKNSGNWETIGKHNETPPLILENYLSYDEIKVSALLSVSSYSYFINDGNRYNNGEISQTRDNIQDEGVIIGLIGTRLEKPNVMEYQELVVTPQQNDDAPPSLRRLFADFYQDIIFNYDELSLLNQTRFIKLDDVYFDNIAYAKRLALSFDTLLMEGNFRAKLEHKMAYIHLVGLGLGVWKLSNHQTKIFLQCFLQRLKFLGPHLTNISDIHFAYISGTNCIKYKNGDVFPIQGHPKNGIKLHISKREPHTKLQDKSKLLIVSYAWDGNALPGNEFWIGMFAASGDCAAAASTQIAELHNPHINKLVCGDNLMIAKLTGDVVRFSEYVQNINP